jgi:hypothetical protein
MLPDGSPLCGHVGYFIRRREAVARLRGKIPRTASKMLALPFLVLGGYAMYRTAS